MEDLVKAVEAADSIYAVLAIAILGLYALIWRYGGKMLDLMRENILASKRAEDRATEVQDTLGQTNHGSDNFGEAIDRLYEMLHAHLDEHKRQDDKDAA